jgi:putative membrane protein
MAETVADRRLHASTLFIRFVKQVPEFVLGLPAFISFASQAGMGRFLMIAAAGACLSFIASLLSWLRFKYGVGEGEIVIEKGVLSRQRRVIPFHRVQDIDIEQRFLARLFGAATVKIETGGAGKNEGNLNAVSVAEAHRLREIIRGASSAAPAGEAAAELPPVEPLLYRMGLKRLAAAGLFNFSLVYLAVIGGVFQFVQPFIDRSLPEPERVSRSDFARFAELGIFFTLAAAALLLLLGVITGVLRTISRDYRFRLSRAPNGFRRQRGLFTLSEVVIPLRRVQLALIVSGWLRRRLGWYDLEFQTLSADAHQSGHQAIAPFARMTEIQPILRETGVDELPDPRDFVRVSRLSILRHVLGAILPLSVLALAIGLFWAPALLAVPALIAGGGIVVVQWRRHRYLLREGMLFIAEGILRQRLWIMPFGKLQTVSVTRSPLQRRFGLATVEIDTAGASPFRYPQIRDLEAGEAEAIAARIVEAFKQSRRGSRLTSSDAASEERQPASES